MEPIHDYRALSHPLAQIRAAEEFYEQVEGFVADMWSEVFSDEPPDEAAVEAVAPAEMLDALASLGLRFEVAAAMTDQNSRTDEGFWALRFSGGDLDALLYGWAYQVMNFVELDHRAFFEALRWTDLIFMPDGDGIASAAYQLLLIADSRQVHLTEKQHEDFEKTCYRVDPARRPHRRGETQRGDGPRTRKPAAVDRAAIILRDAGIPMSPEELANRMKHKNLASLTSALHQAVNYGKPKRLAGWLRREGTGRYQWKQ